MKTILKKLFLLFSLMIVLSSCFDKIKHGAIERLYIGMPKEEALQEIGLEVWDIDYTNYNVLSEEYMFKYHDQGYRKTLTVTFQNNKISSFYTY